MPRLTERVVNRAKARKTKYEISCSVLTGFTLRVLPSGKKVYYVRFRDGSGKDVRERLGPTTELTYAEALTRATATLSGAPQAPAAGPSSVLPSAAPPAEAPKAPTSPLFEEFAERFLREHAGVHLKPNTQRTYRQFLRARILPAFRGIRLAGMRRDEILDLTWEMVDYRHRCFRLPDSKTGQKVVPVSDRALDLVRECREVWEACAFEPKPRHVIYSKNGNRIWSCSLSRTWTHRIRDRLPGFEGVRLHDLRHSMASDAIMAGVPLAVVGKILGHRKAETTARYAHIADSVLSEAVQTVSEAMHHSTKTGKRRKSG